MAKMEALVIATIISTTFWTPATDRSTLRTSTRRMCTTELTRKKGTGRVKRTGNATKLSKERRARRVRRAGIPGGTRIVTRVRKERRVRRVKVARRVSVARRKRMNRALMKRMARIVRTERRMWTEKGERTTRREKREETSSKTGEVGRAMLTEGTKIRAERRRGSRRPNRAEGTNPRRVNGEIAYCERHF